MSNCRRFRRTLVAAAAAGSIGAALTAAGAASASATNITAAAAAPAAGHVYASTNSAFGNAVVVYDRAANGALTEISSVPTGGNGSGAPISAGFEQSQNGLIMGGSYGAEVTPFTQQLFAVNAGSNEISVLTAKGDNLTLVNKVPSGGTKPTSLTIHNNVLYVLNAGVLPLGQGLTPTITGFRIEPVAGGARLVAIPGSTRHLTGSPTTLGATEAGAAEVQFATNGASLTVSERNSNILDTFAVQPDGTLSATPVPTDAGDGTLFGINLPLGVASPFGFAASRLHPGRVFVAQGHEAVPTQGGFGSYDPSSDGGLQPITANAGNGQTDTCWVVLDHNEHLAFVTNFFSGAISSYSLADNGAATLLQSKAASTGLVTNGPSDEAMSANGKFLYERNFITGNVNGYQVAANGTLTPVTSIGGLPLATGFGLAAN